MGGKSLFFFYTQSNVVFLSQFSIVNIFNLFIYSIGKKVKKVVQFVKILYQILAVTVRLEILLKIVLLLKEFVDIISIFTALVNG